MTENNDHDEYRTLFIGNIAENVTEAILYELFLQAGPLEKISLPKSKEGQHRNFAFVTYVHEVSVPYALQLYADTKLFNKTLNLRFRKEKIMPPNQTPVNISYSPAQTQMLSNQSLRQGNTSTMDPNYFCNMNPQITPSFPLSSFNNLNYDQLLMLGNQMMFGNMLQTTNAQMNTQMVNNYSRDDNKDYYNKSRDEDKDYYNKSRDRNVHKSSNWSSNRPHHDKPYSTRDSPPRNSSNNRDNSFNDRYRRDRQRRDNRHNRR